VYLEYARKNNDHQRKGGNLKYCGISLDEYAPRQYIGNVFPIPPKLTSMVTTASRVSSSNVTAGLTDYHARHSSRCHLSYITFWHANHFGHLGFRRRQLT